MYPHTIASIAPALIIIVLIGLAAIFFYLGTKFSSGGTYALDIKERQKQEEEQRIKEKEEDEKWKLPGEWGVATFTQEACFGEVVKNLSYIRSKIGSYWIDLSSDDGWREPPPQSKDIIEKFDYLTAEVERLKISPDLIGTAVKLVVKELQKRRLYKQAKEVADHFGF